MRPFWPGTEHELGVVGQRPRLFEEQIDVPFGRVMTEKRRHASLQLEPVLDRRDFNGGRRPDTLPAALETLLTRGSQLNHCRRLFIFGLTESCSAGRWQGEHHARSEPYHGP